VKRIRFIARKEFYHILRDARSLAIVFAMPVLMTFMYGYAINMDIENVILAIIDYDQTTESHQLRDKIYQSTYFSSPDVEVDIADIEAVLRSGDAHAVLIVRPGFARALENGTSFELGMLVDGSENNIGSAVQAYVSTVVNQYLMDRLPPGFSLPGVRISRQVLYNPDLKSAHFFVPGLVAIILMMISALLTSITIAREKETGTMEQLLTAPVRPVEILVGKLLPYTVIAFLDGVLVLTFARVIFGVPFVGSQWLLFGFGLLYVTTALSIGILISSLVKTQQLAMMLAVLTTLLPSVMLSGFIFSLKNMPMVLQLISNMIPAKFFMIIIRGIMLKGAGLEVVMIQGFYLLILMTILMGLATIRFRTKVV